MNSSAARPEDLSLPRLLFLHGGGVNSLIFETQSRTLLPLLKPHFRPVFVDAPFLCPPHEDVVLVYGTYGPFRRWLRWKHEQAEIDPDSMLEEITYAIRSAMIEDDRKGATGEWVGLVGFSQGAKVAASMLLEQEARERELGNGKGTGTCGIEGVRWRFGVLMAGSAPLVKLHPTQEKSEAIVGLAEISEGFQYLSREEMTHEDRVHTPTFHVHGTLDSGIERHRILLKDYCEEGSTTMMEWEGPHRIPLKTKDVTRTAKGIFDVAKKAGIELKNLL